MTSKNPFDRWSWEKVLVEIHGMDANVPPPPMNEVVFDFKG